MNPDRWPSRRVRVGPFAFHLRSPVRAVMREVDALYRDYPVLPASEVADYMVSVRPASRLRAVFRPKLVLDCDIEIPEMSPLPAAHGLLALEMGMNLQLAVGMQRYLLLHAGAVARGGDALILTGDSGAGKSTLAAMLGHGDWRFLGDEFALVDPATGLLAPFPRPISLKNESIPLLEAVAPADRFGPMFTGTMKGDVRHVVPPRAAIAAMDEPARPRLLVVPAFTPGAEAGARPMDTLQTLAVLIRSSTNYGRMGETGFDAMWALADSVPAYEIVYGSTGAAAGLLDTLWDIHG